VKELKVWNPHTFEIIYEAVESGEGIESDLQAATRFAADEQVESGEGIESFRASPFGASRADRWNPVKELKGR